MASESELRAKTSTFLNEYKGIAEGSTKHKYLIDMFNNSGLCTRYKVTYTDAWCAVAVSDCFIGTNLTSIFPCVECGCSNMITKAQSAGIWVENDAYVPSIGDVVLYDWQDSGSGDNTGTPDHVGIVQSVSGSSFVVIEGNKSDTVGTRTMSINGRYIRGFITPKYVSAASSGTTTTGKKTIEEIAYEVINGDWGNGETRKKLLEEAGYDYDAVQAEVNKLLGTTTSSSLPKFSVGSTYTTQVDHLAVRTGAGVSYTKKTKSQLTTNGQANAYSDGCLKKGTKVTCQATKTVSGNVWMQIPSGWIAAYYDGSKYVK